MNVKYTIAAHSRSVHRASTSIRSGPGKDNVWIGSFWKIVSVYVQHVVCVRKRVNLHDKNLWWNLSIMNQRKIFRLCNCAFANHVYTHRHMQLHRFKTRMQVSCVLKRVADLNSVWAGTTRNFESLLGRTLKYIQGYSLLFQPFDLGGQAPASRTHCHHI